MNNISDKLVLIIILVTTLFVFGLIFSVKSPERKVLDSPIIRQLFELSIALKSDLLFVEYFESETSRECIR